jgi:hypothetical protein
LGFVSPVFPGASYRNLPLLVGFAANCSSRAVAAAAVFLASDEAKQISDATIDVNRGFYFR